MRTLPFSTAYDYVAQLGPGAALVRCAGWVLNLHVPPFST
jgi:hypothetical protein